MKTRHPRWWQLYLAFPVLIGLTVLTHLVHISGLTEELVQIAFVLACFGLLALWLRINAAALLSSGQPATTRAAELIREPPAVEYGNEADYDGAV